MDGNLNSVHPLPTHTAGRAVSSRPFYAITVFVFLFASIVMLCCCCSFLDTLYFVFGMVVILLKV